MTVTAAPNIPVKSVPNGALIAWFGVILLAPDALLIRITGLEGMSLLFWRGLLMGGTLMVLWLIFAARRLRQDIRVALSPVGLLLIGVFTVDAITFAIGITMTSATVMLTALATMPIFTVLFSIPMLGEKPSIQTWLTVLFCGIGIVIVVTSGHEAIGAPTGSPIIGGCLGIFTAAGLGFAMVLKRRYPELPTMLSTGTANMMTVGGGVGIAGQCGSGIASRNTSDAGLADHGHTGSADGVFRADGCPALYLGDHRWADHADRKHYGAAMGVDRHRRTAKHHDGGRFHHCDQQPEFLFPIRRPNLPPRLNNGGICVKNKIANSAIR